MSGWAGRIGTFGGERAAKATGGSRLAVIARARLRRHGILACLASAALSLATVDATAAIGRTEGSWSVSQQGIAQYTVPLWAPPGIGDITPRLELNYDHSVRNGLLGVGWSIGGMSYIARCNRTIAQDGEAAAPLVRDANHEDRFCLDGNRLRLVSGTYGVSGSKYQTEIETFARVTANGSLGTGPAWFKVERRDGLYYYYGKSTDSRLVPTGFTEASVWALYRICDRAGNYLTIRWQQEEGSLRPDYIRYVGTGATSACEDAIEAGDYRADFIYDETTARSDPIQQYDGSAPDDAEGLVLQKRLLQRIEMSYSGSIKRQYRFAYYAGSGVQSRLQTVTECAATSSDCLSPTSFDWYPGASGFTGTTVPIGESIPTSYLFTAELNGDGREDVFWHNGATWRFMLGANTSNGFGAIQGAAPTSGLQWAMPIEWNGDGKTDVLYARGGNFYVRTFGSSDFGAEAPVSVPYSTSYQYWAADVDGDGLDDLVKISRAPPYPDTLAGKIWLRLHRGSGFAAEGVAFQQAGTWLIGGLGAPDGYRTSSIRRQDFDGDGREDLLIDACSDYEPEFGQCLAPEGWIVFVSRVSAGVTVVAPGDIASSRLMVNSYPSYRPLPADFNADDRIDFYYPGQDYWYAAEGGRGGASGVVQGPGVDNEHIAPTFVADYDGDGYSDLLAPSLYGSVLDVMRSTGQTLATGAATNVTSYTLVVDAQGDGLADLLAINGSSYTLWRHNAGSVGSSPNLLHRVTDGFGVSAEFLYAPLSEPSVYTKGTGGSYPDIDYTGSSPVVSRVIVTDGTGQGSTYGVNYTYAGGRWNLLGRAFIGFQRRDIRDESFYPFLETEEVFRQDFPHIGLVASSTIRRYGQSNPIRELTNVWHDPPLTFVGPGNETRYFPYLQSSALAYSELGGSHDGVQYATVTAETDAIDSYGTVTDGTVTWNEMGGTGDHDGDSKSRRIHHTSVLNDVTYWCLGRPESTHVTQSHTSGSGAPRTRDIDQDWDAQKCRVELQTLQDGDAALRVVIDPHYDAFGNVDRRSITGAGMPARVTSISWGTRGQFVESVTDALSFTTRQTWDFGKGVPLTVKDPNQLTTTWTYDTFARRATETRPDQTRTEWQRVACSIGDARVRYCINLVQKKTDGTIYRTDQLFHDQLDRQFLAYQTLPGGALTIMQDLTFDARGRLARTYVPHYQGFSNGYWENTYDTLNRLTEQALHTSAGAFDRNSIVVYDGLRTTVTDPKHNDTTQVRTAWGDLSRIIDAIDGNTWYEFESFGALAKVTDPDNHVTTIEYNDRGMKTSMSDPDMGSGSKKWVYDVDALGEVLHVRDARTIAPAWTTTYRYDALGRVTQRTDEPEQVTSIWTWGTQDSGNNIGRLASISNPTYTESYGYDTAGRLSQRTISIPSNPAYVFDYTYNTFGSLNGIQYPTSTGGFRLRAKYDYDALGYPLRIKDCTDWPSCANSSNEFWEARAYDVRGNVVDETLGNGSNGVVHAVSGFDPLTGLADYRQSGSGGSTTNVQNLSYAWDQNGNLQERDDLRQTPNLKEVFTHDALDRLDYSTLNGAQNLDLDYYADGRIKYKSSVGNGTYTYGNSSHAHAVTSAGGSGGTSFTYDADGNAISRNGGTITWRSDNTPSSIAQDGSNYSQFYYAPDQERYRQLAVGGGVSEETLYLAGLMEIQLRGGVSSYRHYIGTPSGQFVVYERESSGAANYFFAMTDHLGSVDSITNSSGSTFLRLSYDAFGKRRNAIGWTGDPTSQDWTNITNTTRRGYTLHEHVDNLGLVHMNGRIQDPKVGRFLSADPFVPQPLDPQSLDRYSYVRNSPPTLTDPSGFDEDVSGESGISEPWERVWQAWLSAAAVQRWGWAGGFDGGYVPPHRGRFPTHDRAVSLTAGPTQVELALGAPTDSPLIVPESPGQRFGELASLIGVRIGPDVSIAITVADVAGLAANIPGLNLIATGVEVGALLAAGDTLGALEASIEFVPGAKLFGSLGRLGRAALKHTDDLADLRARIKSGAGLVIGRLKDLGKEGALKPGEYKLDWPPLVSKKAEWKTNGSLLRQAMRQGKPIRDISPEDDEGIFLNAERNLLDNWGWKYDKVTGYWKPPQP